MVQVKIFYSLRKTNGLPTLKLFADELCAKSDQELFKFWKEPCYGNFNLDVKGYAYVDAVVTREDYIKELEHLDKSTKISKIIENLRR